MMIIDVCIHEEEHNRVRVVISEREREERIVGEKIGLESRLTMMMMMMMIMMIDMCIYS